MSTNMKQMRSKMEEDEQLRVLMAGFRGQNLDESDFAREDVRMNLMEMSVDEDFDDQLPLYYDPEAISAYWDCRWGGRGAPSQLAAWLPLQQQQQQQHAQPAVGTYPISSCLLSMCCAMF
jgi:hypothetical protein